MDEHRPTWAQGEAEDSYRRLFENLPVGVYRSTVQGRLLDANPAMVSLLGFPDREKLLQIDLADLYPDPGGRERWLAQVREQSTESSVEMELRRNDGSLIWVQDSVHAVRDEEGRLVGFEGCLIDLSDRREVENTLRRERTFLSALLDTVSALVVVLDLQGRIVLFNRACERLTGYSQEEVKGRELWNLLLAPQEREGVREVFQDLVRGRSPSRYENDWIDKNGQHRRIVWDNSVLLDQRGAVEYVIGTGIDITERKQAEEQSHLLSNALDASANGMVITDRQGAILWVNPAFTALTGYSSEEAVGHTLRMLKSGRQDPDFYREMWGTILAGKVWQGEVINRRKDGSFYAEEMTITPVRDEQDEVTHFIAVKQDVSERKRAEEVLATERERLSTTLRSLREGVIAVGQGGVVVFANPAGEEHLALLAGTGVGGVLASLVDKPLASFLQAEGSVHEVVVEQPRRRVFEVSGRPSEPDAARGWVLVTREVTHEREMQERVRSQERLAAVGQLAAGIAHDFNNVLQGILGFCELLQRRADLSEPGRHYVESIQQQSQRAAQLVRQILDFSLTSISRQQPVELGIALRNSMALLRQTIPESVVISLNIEAGEYWVRADLAQLTQALINLAVNGRDAMPEGGELILSLARRRWESADPPPLSGLPPGEWVVWQIADTGTGISPEVLPHIFEPFFTTKKPTQGTGLGLAQVYGIVQQHGGFIEVATQPGEGTCFTIYLPLLRKEKEPDLGEPLSEAPQGRGELILMVEDDATVLDVIREMLAALNYQVVAAHDDLEALEIYERWGSEIALILTDMVMPRMSGLELVKTLRARGCQAKLVVISGYPLGQGLPKQWDQEVAIWLRKPLDQHMLAWAIQEALAEGV